MKKHRALVICAIVVLTFIGITAVYFFRTSNWWQDSYGEWQTIYTHDENGELIDHSSRKRCHDFQRNSSGLSCIIFFKNSNEFKEKSRFADCCQQTT
jgi:hypothetical protein